VVNHVGPSTYTLACGGHPGLRARYAQRSPRAPYRRDVAAGHRGAAFL